jgi:D-arabinose 1-dehydrogenase-like Zn-dependent alcohol dehydrogenase
MKAPQMRALRLDLATGRHDLADVRRPRPAANEVLIHVAAAAVGRLDRDVLDWQVDAGYPGATALTAGHEFAGRVAAPGAGVNGWPLGRRVAVHPVITDRSGADAWLGVHRDGGWAEYAVAPASALVQLPDSVPFEQAALLPSSVATPFSALTVTAGLRPGEAIGIWGIGGLGTHAVQLARLLGAAPVIAVDPAPAARKRAVGLGADVALDPASEHLGRDLRAATRGALLDVAVDLSGAPHAAAQAIAALSPAGRAVLVGPPEATLAAPGTGPLALGRRRVLGHLGPAPGDLVRVLRLVEFGRLDLSASVTGVRPLEAAVAAVAEAARTPGESVRLVLRISPAGGAPDGREP